MELLSPIHHMGNACQMMQELPSSMLRWEQVFAPLKTWSKFILTSDEAFESKYGSQADKNGNFIMVP